MNRIDVTISKKDFTWNSIRKRISSLIDEDGVADVELLGVELPGVDDDRVGNFPAPLA